MRAIGDKAVDIRRADPDFLFAEESVNDTKRRTGILAGAVVLGFAAGVFGAICNLFGGASRRLF